MKFNKSLAAFGLLASVASPASAFDLYSLQFSVDEARALLSDWLDMPARRLNNVSAAAVPSPMPLPLLSPVPVVTEVRLPSPVATALPAPVYAAPAVAAPAYPAAGTVAVAAPVYAAPVYAATYTAGSGAAGNMAPAVVRISAPVASVRVASREGVGARAGWSEDAADRAADSSLAVVVDTVVETVVRFAADTAAAVGTMVDNAVTTAGNALDNLALAAAGATEAVSNTVSGAIDTATNVAGQLGDAVVDLVAPAAGGTTTRELLGSNMMLGTQPQQLAAGNGGLTPAAPVEQPDAGALPSPGDIAADSSFTAVKIPEVISGNGRTFYVDFASGDDANSGTSPGQPWKRAPGDIAATGNARSAVLKGGDTVRFRGGVAYRGSLQLRQSGDAGAPIIYTGTGFGTGRAIWDGADAATSAVKCPSQAACGGAANWQSLLLASFTAPPTAAAKLYDGLGPLYEAMTPLMQDAFWNDSLDSFATIPAAQASAMASGRLENAALAAVARSEPGARLAVWVQGNEVEERKILSISGNTIFYDAAGGQPYTDRDNKAAVVGAVKSVTKPGLYANLGNGKAVVYPRQGGGSQYFVGAARSGFDLNSQSNITIHGLDFVRGTVAKGVSRGTTNGVVLGNFGKTVSNIRFEGNRVSNFSVMNGMGTIHLNYANNVQVRGNSFANLEGASAMRFVSEIKGLVVEGNSVRKVGRDGIYLGVVSNAQVRGNIVSEAMGVHGNAMAYYLGHRNVTVSENCVFASVRPLTYHGDNSGVEVSNLKIVGNIFVSAPEGSSAIYSWGKKTNTVLVQNNLAIGQKAGVILDTADTNVTVVGNRTAGVLIPGAKSAVPTGWTIGGNDNSAVLADAAQAVLKQNQCSATAMKGKISITL